MRFTILLATYNRLNLLIDSLDSALHQQYSDYEILVVDDGSESETKEYLKRLDFEKLRVIYQNNQGVAHARQVGLENAKGDYIVILDSDDQLKEDALLCFDSYVSKNSSVDVFYCNNIEHKIDSQKMHQSNYPAFSSNSNFIYSIFTRPRVPFKHSGMVFNADVARQLGGYDSSLPNKIDIDLMLKFLDQEKKVMLIPEYLVKFNMHSDSISFKRLKGIPTWNRLIGRYGKGCKICLKFIRLLIEVLKYFYSLIFIKRY